jgi:hypothetical protein
MLSFKPETVTPANLLSSRVAAPLMANPDFVSARLGYATASMTCGGFNVVRDCRIARTLGRR